MHQQLLTWGLFIWAPVGSNWAKWDDFHPIFTCEKSHQAGWLSLASAPNCFKARIFQSLYSESQPGLECSYEKCEYHPGWCVYVRSTKWDLTLDFYSHCFNNRFMQGGLELFRGPGQMKRWEPWWRHYNILIASTANWGPLEKIHS